MNNEGLKCTDYLICGFSSVNPRQLKPTLFKDQLAVGNLQMQRVDLSWICDGWWFGGTVVSAITAPPLFMGQIDMKNTQTLGRSKSGMSVG